MLLPIREQLNDRLAVPVRVHLNRSWLIFCGGQVLIESGRHTPTTQKLVMADSLISVSRSYNYHLLCIVLQRVSYIHVAALELETIDA